MKKVKTIEIKNLQAPEIQELDDSEVISVVGGIRVCLPFSFLFGNDRCVDI
ncbi:hypothetical protein [Nostoc sp. MG11]|uniref:hypothetical protein n=1 Tax=Nostoc sp. MG11 TaxID=2721166 RepID=UPI001868D09C|nr:hypothetical protein [Nostoc sp. MG11]